MRACMLNLSLSLSFNFRLWLIMVLVLVMYIYMISFIYIFVLINIPNVCMYFLCENPFKASALRENGHKLRLLVLFTVK